MGKAEHQASLLLEDLPPELLIHIISFLDLEDRCQVRLVNKYFNELCWTPELIKNDVYIVEDINDLETFNFERRYNNIQIQKATFDCCNDFQFWRECGRFVISIEMILTKVVACNWSCMFHHTQNLVELNIDMFRWKDDRVIMPTYYFPKLKSVTLTPGVHLSGELFKKIVMNAPCLEHLKIIWKNLKAGPHFDRGINDFFLKQGNVLKTIDSNYFHKDYITKPLFTFVGKQLTVLRLKKQDYPENFLFNLCKAFPNLREIGLSWCAVKGNVVSYIFNKLTHVTHITPNNSAVKDDILELLKDRSDILKIIDFSNCSQLTQLGLVQGFNKISLNRLIELKLDQLPVTDYILELILNSTPNIQSLSLNNCSLLTISSLTTIASKCKKVRELMIEGWVSLWYIEGLSKMKCLERLSIKGCPRVTTCWLAQEIKFPNLKWLNLIETLIESDDCQRIIDQCPRLREIHLNREIEISSHQNRNVTVVRPAATPPVWPIPRIPFQLVTNNIDCPRIELGRISPDESLAMRLYLERNGLTHLDARRRCKYNE